MTKPRGVLSAGGVLDRIVEAKTLRLQEAKRARPLEQITALLAGRYTLQTRRLSARLARQQRTSIIAEIKRRSPSRGIIREDFDPISIAAGFSAAGAAALSVLTEEDFFEGSLDYLRAVRSRVDLPLLRKDFIFDEYQIYESAEAGADAVLLIVAILDDDLLARLIRLAFELGLEPLVEVHTPREMERAASCGAGMIGVNNRDLITFKVDLETSERLAELAPLGAILVSESGIETARDIERLKSKGFQAFLIGEHLMRAKDPGAALASLISEA